MTADYLQKLQNAMEDARLPVRNAFVIERTIGAQEPMPAWFDRTGGVEFLIYAEAGAGIYECRTRTMNRLNADRIADAAKRDGIDLDRWTTYRTSV